MNMARKTTVLSLVCSAMAFAAPAVLANAPLNTTPGIGFVGPGVVPGKEYSTRLDSGVLPLGGTVPAGMLVPAPMQTLHWTGGDPGVVDDGLNYGITALPGTRPPGNEVDAMANRADHLFTGPDKVSDDKFHLLYNVGNESLVRWEAPKVMASDVWAKPHTAPTPNGAVLGVDALEVWGGEHGGLDADRYSLLGDPGGVSVFKMDGTTFLTQAAIAGAIGLPTQYYSQLDVDALMVGDADRFVLFSIAPIAAFDGGEIWVWDLAKPAATFMTHGGHVWDTAFDVMGTYHLASEDVTVLEAVDVSLVPEAHTYAMMLAGLGLLGWVGHRRRTQT